MAPNCVPSGAEALAQSVWISDLNTIVWRGDVSLLPQERVVMVLGIVNEFPEFVRSALAAVSAKHDHLILWEWPISSARGFCCSVALKHGQIGC